MRNTKKLDLLTEVNLMRNMMGLNSKTLITEAIIPIPLLKSFAKTATKFASGTVNDLTAFLGASARTTKTMFDDLDAAIKAGDSVTAKKMVTNIVNTLDNIALTNLANDILADTADDALRSVITKRAQALKAAGGMDDAIRTQIKTDLDVLLDDIPDTLKMAVKDQVGVIVDTTLRSIKSVGDNAELIAKAMREELQLQKTIADQFNTIRLKIEGLPSFKKLSSAEKNTVREVLKDTANKTPKQLFDETETYIMQILKDPYGGKDRKWLTSFGQALRDPKGIALTIGSGTILLITLLLLTGKLDLAGSVFKEAKKDIFDDGDTETTTPVGDCPGESSLVSYLASLGSELESFDEDECYGVDNNGIDYTWDIKTKSWL